MKGMTKAVAVMKKPLVSRTGNGDGQSNQEGWAIVETMIAVIIGLMMLAGVFVGVNMTLDANKKQGAKQNLASIRMSVKQFYSGQPDYTSLDNSLCKTAELVPASMIKSAGIRNSWNGSVTIAPVAGDTSQFYIQLSGIPEAEAFELAVNASADMWQEVQLNGTTITIGGTGVSAAQSAVTTGETNTLYFASY